MAKSGILFVNLGTPESAEPKDVGIYLKEFLMDPYVIDIAAPLRWILVNLLIVPKRKYDSAALYKNIWTSEGSPLLIYSEKFLEKYKNKYPKTPVALAMRYGKPSIEDGMKELISQGVEDIKVFPMYPHYASSSVETCLVKCKEVAKKLSLKGELSYYREFFDNKYYIDVLAKTVKETLESKNLDYVLYSYHGLPEHQVAQTGTKCEFKSECCASFRDHSPKCYRAQVYETSKLCNEKIGFDNTKSMLGFQSRLGNRPWLKPYVEDTLEDIVKKGHKEIAVACPAFTADCLETLEEISIRLQEDFEKK